MNIKQFHFFFDIKSHSFYGLHHISKSEATSTDIFIKWCRSTYMYILNLCFAFCDATFLYIADILFFQEIYSKYLTPLQPIAREPQPYVSKHTVSQSLSPYYLSNEDPQKNFMSGNYIRINQSIDTYSKTCLIWNLYNPIPCVDRHWFSFPFDH